MVLKHMSLAFDGQHASIYLTSKKSMTDEQPLTNRSTALTHLNAIFNDVTITVIR